MTPLLSLLGSGCFWTLIKEDGNKKGMLLSVMPT